ncbi:MAG TPA: hypothetical protein ENH55_10445 [Aurantimonas coralicida]|uniref:Rhodanese domain-containing protein n=2 Tax=root TaxID=1 RepID=A0A9C9NET3_9HYPH|nr:hypothetical protein [Aurantimonas coralicida]HET99858.1 hypothetical protein [Aurantimonas coralicida]
MSRTICAADAKAAVHGGAEIAFLDVREAGQFADGHPLFAIPCPYSRLEAGTTLFVVGDTDLGEPAAADRLMQVIAHVTLNGPCTPDMGGRPEPAT